MSSLKFNKEQLSKALLDRARYVAEEVTKEFFEVVDDEMPVQNGHAHETLGTGLLQCSGDLVGVGVVASQMLAKGSADPEASSRGYGQVKENKHSISVVVGTSVGFVQKLNDGETIYPGDLTGNTGPKKDREDEGRLYGSRLPTGVGFLFWQTGGYGQVATYSFARSMNWGQLHFFEKAAEAATQKANTLGAF